MPCEMCKRCFTCGRSPDHTVPANVSFGQVRVTWNDGEGSAIESTRTECPECGIVTEVFNMGSIDTGAGSL